VIAINGGQCVLAWLERIFISLGLEGDPIKTGTLKGTTFCQEGESCCLKCVFNRPFNLWEGRQKQSENDYQR